MEKEKSNQVGIANMLADVKEVGCLADDVHISLSNEYPLLPPDNKSPYRRTDYSYSRWSGNDFFSVFVGDLDLPNKAYVQLSPFNTNKVLDLVQEYELKELNKQKNVEWSRNVGSPCLAYYKVDGQLYRATIIELVDDPNNRKIQFVDFGNCDVVNIKDIFQIPKKFLSYPEGATQCLIVDLFLPNLVFPDEEQLKVMFEYKNFQCQMMGVTTSSKGLLNPVISLFDEATMAPVRSNFGHNTNDIGVKNTTVDQVVVEQTIEITKSEEVDEGVVEKRMEDAMPIKVDEGVVEKTMEDAMPIKVDECVVEKRTEDAMPIKVDECVVEKTMEDAKPEEVQQDVQQFLDTNVITLSNVSHDGHNGPQPTKVAVIKSTINIEKLAEPAEIVVPSQEKTIKISEELRELLLKSCIEHQAKIFKVSKEHEQRMDKEWRECRERFSKACDKNREWIKKEQEKFAEELALLTEKLHNIYDNVKMIEIPYDED